MTTDFTQLIDQLVSGEREELVVTPEKFEAFRAVWAASLYRANLIGEARHNGEIAYRYEA